MKVHAMAYSDSSYRSRINSSRILIIEDDWIITDLIANIVLELGYAVSGIAGTFATACRELNKRNFDAALIDIGLDGLHGPEIADRLLQLKLPFGFVTGYDSPFEERHAMVPLLHKPFTAMELEELLEKLIGPARGWRESIGARESSLPTDNFR